MRPTRILVAVDDRPTSLAAVRWAAARAVRRGAAIDLVSVATDDDVLLAAARSAVEAARTEILRLAPSVDVDTAVPGGKVYDVLLEMSAHADLFVVGSDRPSALRAFLHGGLPMRLAGRVSCSLVVVPSGWSGVAGTSIAVGWDDDRAAEAAVEAAAVEADEAHLPLRIHHVWRPIAVSPFDLAGGAALISEIEDEERSAVERIVREVSARHPGVAVTGELHLGSSGSGILGYASQADLVVVGSHRRWTISEILTGATGDVLIAATRRIPVMVVAPAPSRSAGSDDHQNDDDDHQDRDHA